MNRLRETAGQGVRARASNLHPHHLPQKTVFAIEMDDSEVRRAAGNSPTPVHGVDEDVLDAPYPSSIGFPLVALLVVQDHLKSPLFLLGGDVVVHPGGRRSRPGRVRKHEQAAEAI